MWTRRRENLPEILLKKIDRYDVRFWCYYIFS